jgi:hypothetical protein
MKYVHTQIRTVLYKTVLLSLYYFFFKLNIYIKLMPCSLVPHGTNVSAQKKLFKPKHQRIMVIKNHVTSLLKWS